MVHAHDGEEHENCEKIMAAYAHVFFVWKSYHFTTFFPSLGSIPSGREIWYNTTMAQQRHTAQSPTHPLTHFFRRISQKIARVVGSPYAFTTAVLFVLTWLALGPTFHYSTNWQLVINTATTIITFLMVFLLQNTQNRDTKALHLKLDELIYVNKKARNALLDAEELFDDEEMEREEEEFKKKREKSAY